MPRKGYIYRGTRPKHARSVSSDEFSIYCELCECEYSVSRTTPVDQWLNRHQAHTDCLEKKASREAVVDEDGIFVRRYVRPRTLSSSDRVFVFDGVPSQVVKERFSMLNILNRNLPKHTESLF